MPFEFAKVTLYAWADGKTSDTSYYSTCFVSFLWTERKYRISWMISCCESSICSSDKTHHRQTRGFTQGCLHFFFFGRGSYKSSYSLNNFLLEGEVNILNKTVQLPNAFMCKAERLIGNTIRYMQNFLSFRKLMVERGYPKLTIQLFERSNHVHTHTHLFWFRHPAFSL